MEYHNRAWCSVEVMMVQTLRKSYHLHSWYEHVKVNKEDYGLQQGSLEFEAVVTGKQSSVDEDRPKILFLERQSKLFRRT